MMTVSHRSLPRDASYVVPGPRATDAIGEALRDAYRPTPPLPDDLATLLMRVDSIGNA